MDDVAEAMAAVKRDLIEVLPKMRRAGRTDVSDLKVSVNAAGLGAPLRRGVSTGGCRGGLLPRCTCAYRPWAGATSCGLPRSSDCVGFCVAFPQEPSFSRRKTKLCVVLLGELSHLGKEWQEGSRHQRHGQRDDQEGYRAAAVNSPQIKPPSRLHSVSRRSSQSPPKGSRWWRSL